MKNIFKICFIITLVLLQSCTKTKKEVAVLSDKPPVTAVAEKVTTQETAIPAPTKTPRINTESPRLPAIIKAENVSGLGFQVSGIIKKLNVKAGDEVKKNQILASLDSTLAGLDKENAKIDLASKEVTFHQVERKYTSYSSLFKTGVLSKITFEDEENNYKIAELNFESAKLNLKAKEYALQLTSLTAPFDGVISKSYKSLGDFTTPGSSVFDLVQTNDLSVFAQVPVAFFGRIRTGMIFSILNPLTEQTGNMTVQKVVPIIDTQSRTFDIYGKINEAAHNFFPGMYVEIILK